MSEEQTLNIIEQCLNEAREEAVEYYADKIRKKVYSKIYKKKESNYYDRTEGFLKSVSNPKILINVSGDYKIALQDESKIRSSNGKKGKFGHHKSFPWSEPYPSNEEVKENLFDWLNEGFTILGKKKHKGFNFDVPAEVYKKKYYELAAKKIKKRLKIK